MMPAHESQYTETETAEYVDKEAQHELCAEDRQTQSSPLPQVECIDRQCQAVDNETVGVDVAMQCEVRQFVHVEEKQSI